MSANAIHLLVLPLFGLGLTVLGYFDEHLIVASLRRFWVAESPVENFDTTLKLVKASIALGTFVPSLVLFIINSFVAVTLLGDMPFHAEIWVGIIVVVFLLYDIMQIFSMDLMDIAEDELFGIPAIVALRYQQVIFTLVTCILFVLAFFFETPEKAPDHHALHSSLSTASLDTELAIAGDPLTTTPQSQRF